MKKVLVGLAAAGGLVVVGVLARRVAKALAAHAREMAERCEQMAASGRGERASGSPTAKKRGEAEETQRARPAATA